MRKLVIDRLIKHFNADEGFDEDYEEYLNFSVPKSEADIKDLTDEQLVDLLEIYGVFLG